MKLRVNFTIDLGWVAPWLRLMGPPLRRVCARLVRLHVSQLRPMAPTSLHRRNTLRLAKLEARS